MSRDWLVAVLLMAATAAAAHPAPDRERPWRARRYDDGQPDNQAEQQWSPSAASPEKKPTALEKAFDAVRPAFERKFDRPPQRRAEGVRVADASSLLDGETLELPTYVNVPVTLRCKFVPVRGADNKFEAVVEAMYPGHGAAPAGPPPVPAAGDDDDRVAAITAETEDRSSGIIKQLFGSAEGWRGVGSKPSRPVRRVVGSEDPFAVRLPATRWSPLPPSPPPPPLPQLVRRRGPQQPFRGTVARPRSPVYPSAGPRRVQYPEDWEPHSDDEYAENDRRTQQCAERPRQIVQYAEADSQPDEYYAENEQPEIPQQAGCYAENDAQNYAENDTENDAKNDVQNDAQNDAKNDAKNDAEDREIRYQDEPQRFDDRPVELQQFENVPAEPGNQLIEDARLAGQQLTLEPSDDRPVVKRANRLSVAKRDDDRLALNSANGVDGSDLQATGSETSTTAYGTPGKPVAANISTEHVTTTKSDAAAI